MNRDCDGEEVLVYGELVFTMNHALCLCELFLYSSLPIVENYVKFGLDSVPKIIFLEDL